MPNNKIIKDKENVEEYVENIKKILIITFLGETSNIQKSQSL
jgi:hypothetical protein